MKKLKCFLCGAKYNPENREAVASILAPTKEDSEAEVIDVKYVRFQQKVLRLCPSCTLAAVFGITIGESSNPEGFRWLGDIEYEEG